MPDELTLLRRIQQLQREVDALQRQASKMPVRFGGGAGTGVAEGVDAATDPPPDVAAASATGTSQRYARADHTHGYPLTIVAHGENENVSRPATWDRVLWLGEVQPLNAIPGDIWFDFEGFIYIADTKANLPNVDPPAFGYATNTGVGYWRVDDGTAAWVAVTHWETS